MISLFQAIVIVTNMGYIAAFDTFTKCPSWISYDLEPHEVVRTNRVAIPFSEDPRIRESNLGQAYAGSGFDRGHMAPAADFNWDMNALKETYYFSNVCPQVPSVNRGIWLDIEKEMRMLASSGTVHILTFPMNISNRINGVGIPGKFVKVAYGYFGIRTYVVDNSTNGTFAISR